MQIIEDRRALHRIPELDHQLPETMAYLENALKGLKCKVFSPMESSLAVWFDFGADHAIAFRSDADALPVTEKNEVSYASCHPGKMHACGHDGHMAMALELARRLDKKESLPHNVLIVFQPAEETTGGARDLCDTGIFEKYHVKTIFGMHLWPGQEAGTVSSRKEEMMSRSCELMVDIWGKPAHIARAEEGIDSLAAGVDFYSRVTALERQLPEQVFRLLKFGKFESGTVGNVLSGHTHMHGSLRAFQDEIFYSLRDGIYEAAKAVEETYGCRVEIFMDDGYPAVLNPGELYDRVKKIVPFADLPKPSMITEDFSWYQRRIPGMFFFLGTGNTPALHNDRFDFDETILLKGADFFEKLAEEFQ